MSTQPDRAQCCTRRSAVIRAMKSSAWWTRFLPSYRKANARASAISSGQAGGAECVRHSGNVARTDLACPAVAETSGLSCYRRPSRGGADSGPTRPYFLRSRLAFAVALACHGASNEAADGAFRDRPSKAADWPSAAAFSCTILAYSVGEHVPCTIIRLRRPIVSQEARLSSIIIPGRDRATRRLRLLISAAAAAASWMVRPHKGASAAPR